MTLTLRRDEKAKKCLHGAESRDCDLTVKSRRRGLAMYLSSEDTVDNRYLLFDCLRQAPMTLAQSGGDLSRSDAPIRTAASVGLDSLGGREVVVSDKVQEHLIEQLAGRSHC